MSKRSLEFWVRYNWPTGKASVSTFRLSPSNADLTIKVLAERKNDPTKKYTFTELSKGSFKASYVTEILQNKASVGNYLTGDVFYVEVFDGSKAYVGGTRLDVAKKWPNRANGPTHVESQYFLDLN